MDKLPEFAPIEHQFPEWLTARITVETALPEYLRFKVEEMHHECNVMLDFDWAQDLMGLVPIEDKEKLEVKLYEAWGLATKVIDIQPIETYVMQPVIPITINKLNMELRDQDNKRVLERKPTTIQILRHVLGLSSAF